MAKRVKVRAAFGYTDEEAIERFRTGLITAAPLPSPGTECLALACSRAVALFARARDDVRRTLPRLTLADQDFSHADLE